MDVEFLVDVDDLGDMVARDKTFWPRRRWMFIGAGWRARIGFICWIIWGMCWWSWLEVLKVLV